jgi:Ulp1 family protease
MLSAGASTTVVIEIPATRQTNCSDCGLYVLAFAQRLCSLLRGQPLGKAHSKRLDGATLPEPDVATGITQELLETECANVQVDGMRREILKLITERSLPSH